MKANAVKLSLFLLTFGLTLAPGLVGARAADPKPVDFIHEVLPIFKAACFDCHGPDKMKASLRLDVKSSALAGGENGPVIIAGHGDESPLVERLRETSPDERMPSKEKALPTAEIDLIRDWIDQGAIWPEPAALVVTDPAKHWAFQPLSRTAPPAVQDSAWGRTPVDNFILARLEANQLHPNPEAERGVLIRRAYLDLTGLPPTPEEVDAFVKDPAADAYSRLIDHLLASPHYGERWARHWLDTARFGESHGFEQDYDRPYAYWYRDFVIKALNENLPFDQFIRWQLAGDEFAPDNPWAMAATGFLGAGVFPTQLTEAEFEPARYDELDNMAATTGTAMLGLTIGCARCHDHKFDPIPSRDYYRFIATFAKTIRSDIELDFAPEKYRAEKARFDAAQSALVAARTAYERDELPARCEAWLKAAPLTGLAHPDWLILDLDGLTSQAGATLNKLADGSVLVTGKNPDHDTYTFTARVESTNLTGLRVEALADPSLVKGGPGRAGNGNFQFTDLHVTAMPSSGGGPPVEVKLVNPRATFEQNASLAVATVVDGDPHSGWAVDPKFGTNHAAVFQFQNPVQFPGGAQLKITLAFNGNTQHTIGRPRVSVATGSTTLPLAGESAPQSLTELFARLNPADGTTGLTETERQTVRNYYAPRDPGWQKLDAAVQEHLRAAPKPEVKKVMVTSEGYKPIPHHADDRGFPHFYAQTFFLKRGDTHQKGEEATPGFLQILNHAPDGDQHWQTKVPDGSRTSGRRRALATWMTDAQYGAGDLLARVAVNRVWQHHFGRGLVATPNDFGTQGARPTHPELLDWLAADFQQHGWDLQHLHRLIMTSAVYLQSGARDEARNKIDPDNQWLWHRDHQRLEAEAIRDSLLQVSGQLEDRLYGPGTLDETMHRRSIYFFLKRSQFIPILQLFDAPDPSVSTGSRVATTIAPQALLFMNNPNVRAYALALAHRLQTNADKSLAEAITQGYRLTVGRRPSTVEVKDATAFIERQRRTYETDPPPAASPLTLALADFCQVLFGLNEFIYLE